MRDEKIKKVRMYLKEVGLSETEIAKQLANPDLLEAYLSQVNAYEENMQRIMAAEMLKDDNVNVEFTDNNLKSK